MTNVDDYIMIQNLIPTPLCRSLIRESSLPESKWSKHSWYNYGRDDLHSMPEKELDIINSTGDQFKSLGNYLGTALQNYQKKYSIPSGLRHSVPINLKKESRYSLAFNSFCFSELGAEDNSTHLTFKDINDQRR